MQTQGNERPTAADSELQEGTIDTSKQRGKAMRKASHQREHEPQGDGNAELDPVLALLDDLPVEDEPLTDDERRDIREGWSAYRRGNTIPAEEAKQACRDAQGEKTGSKVTRKIPA